MFQSHPFFKNGKIQSSKDPRKTLKAKPAIDEYVERVPRETQIFRHWSNPGMEISFFSQIMWYLPSTLQVLDEIFVF